MNRKPLPIPPTLSKFIYPLIFLRVIYVPTTVAILIHPTQYCLSWLTPTIVFLSSLINIWTSSSILCFFINYSFLFLLNIIFNKQTTPLFTLTYNVFLPYVFFIADFLSLSNPNLSIFFFMVLVRLTLLSKFTTWMSLLLDIHFCLIIQM